MRCKKQFVLVLLPIVLMFLSSIVFWNSLPDQLPTHLNARGLADKFSSKGRVLLGLPLLHLSIVILSATFEKISQRFFQDKSILSSQQILFALGLVFLFLQSNIIAVGLGANQRGFSLDQLILGFIFIVLGLFAKTVDRNRWVGIRLPWTLASEENWRLTHELWGKLLMAIGCLSILVSPWFHDASIALYAGIISTILAIIYSIVQGLRTKAKR